MLRFTTREDAETWLTREGYMEENGYFIREHDQALIVLGSGCTPWWIDFM